MMEIFWRYSDFQKLTRGSTSKGNKKREGISSKLRRKRGVCGPISSRDLISPVVASFARTAPALSNT